MLAQQQFQTRIGDAQLARFQRPRQYQQDARHLERLDDVIERARLHGLHGRGDRAFARHDDAGQVGIDLARRFHHGDAVYARHHQVDQQQVERFGGQQRQRRLARSEPRRVVCLAAQGVAQRAHMRQLVIDDQ
ncbi:hypothetical protein D3C81_1278600 [compost metagenome]